MQAGERQVLLASERENKMFRRKREKLAKWLSLIEIQIENGKWSCCMKKVAAKSIANHWPALITWTIPFFSQFYSILLLHYLFSALLSIGYQTNRYIYIYIYRFLREIIWRRRRSCRRISQFCNELLLLQFFWSPPPFFCLLAKKWKR